VEGGQVVGDEERERKEGGVNGYQELAGEEFDSVGAHGVGEEFADP
jgi:hypothetical protein